MFCGNKYVASVLWTYHFGIKVFGGKALSKHTIGEQHCNVSISVYLNSPI